jgi:hypothetical protein
MKIKTLILQVGKHDENIGISFLFVSYYMIYYIIQQTHSFANHGLLLMFKMLTRS